ncbi:MAG: 4-hydroxy-tetrahydrodipicolinate reductase [Acidobacteria bacterium]|nr:4-hydroxy-tetrahydrodipicolinate reductase [Acidobacteriota bacterium]
MRILLVGRGRMGRAIEALSGEFNAEVVERLTSRNNPHGAAITSERLSAVDVAIDFSAAGAVVENVPRLAALGINLVIGTTGWQDREASLRETVAKADIGVVAAPNMSVAVVLFQAIIEQAARLFGRRDDFDAWVHELHHSAKRDAPSGTARAVVAAMTKAGFSRRIDVASTRAGLIPGTHTVGFEGPFESVTLTHTTRDRATFARGALEAARWVQGRRGWFTMRDVLGLRDSF